MEMLHVVAPGQVALRIGGAAGDGVDSTGETMSRTFSRSGQHVFAYRSYQSAIRGGHVWYQIRAGNQKVLSQGDRVDILVALNRETVDINVQDLRDGGLIIHDKDKVRLDPSQLPRGITNFPVPMAETARKYSKNPVMQNTFALGTIIQTLGLDLEVFRGVLRHIFGDKGEAIMAANMSVAGEGFQYAAANLKGQDYGLERTGVKRYILTGNHAICLGAVAAGCKFYSAYPMTPASSILHWLADHSEGLGVLVKQAEDEIAVVNMALGASFAGVRSMCGTSGGGFSLMVETVGLAGMTETPLVVVESQRAGPSTGLPTKTEQADLNMALGASQGDFPRVVLAPLDVADCFYTTARAFNLAEKYQVPVIILVDLYLSEHLESIDGLSLDVPIDRGLIAEMVNGGKYLRYEITENGISPRSIPGTEGLEFVGASDEHDEDSKVVSDILAGIPRYIEVRKRMMEKRMRKLEYMKMEMELPRVYGEDDADLTIVCWGSTSTPVMEAIDRLRRDGLRVNALMFRDLFPMRSLEIGSLLSKCRFRMNMECNYTGQLARLLRAETGIAMHDSLYRYDGEPFTPGQIYDKCVEVLRRV